MIHAAKKRPLCVICLFLMMLISVAKTAGIPVFGQPPDHPFLQTCTQQNLTVQVIGTIADREEKDRSVQYILTNSYLRSETQTIPLHTITMISTKKQALPAEAVILVSGTLSVPEKASNPGQFDLWSYYASRRIYYSLFAESCTVLQPGGGFRETVLRLKNKLAEKTDAITDEETAELLKAILLGDRTELTVDTKRSYQVGGILHILAISGMHISFLGMGLLKILQKARLPFPLAAASSFSFLCGYCLLTGASPSSIRAVCMFAVLMGAKLLHRTYDSLCALALAGILMLLENPAVLFSSGFQLSFCSILTVAFVWPAVAWLLPPQVRKPGKLFVKAGIGLAEKRELRRRSLRGWSRYYFRLFQRYAFFWLTINIAMLPLTAWYYYEIPVWGLLPNLLLIPLVPVILSVGVPGILAAWIRPDIATCLLLPVSWLLKGVRILTGMIRALPLATYVCGKPEIRQLILSVILFLFLSAFLHRQKERMEEGRKNKMNKKKEQIRCRKVAAAGLGLGLFLLLPHWESAWSLTMLDVGQGDCLVLRDRQNCFLIDGGSSSVKEVGKYRIIPYLKSQGISHLDGVFLTHPDEDHVNGVLELFQAMEERSVTMKLDCLYLPDWMQGTEDEMDVVKAARRVNARVVYLARGDTLSSKMLRIQVLNPFRKKGIRSGNSGSLVLSVSCGEFDALLTGDLESDGEDLLLPMDKSYEYLKAAHHGSKGSSSERFLAQICPTVTAVSAPLNSRYGHPHRETMERLEKAGSEIYVTRDCGAIRVEGNRKKWRLWGYLHTETADKAG